MGKIENDVIKMNRWKQNHA